MITLTVLAERSGLSYDHLRAMARRGQLRLYDGTGRQVLVDEDEAAVVVSAAALAAVGVRMGHAVRIARGDAAALAELRARLVAVADVLAAAGSDRGGV